MSCSLKVVTENLLQIFLKLVISDNVFFIDTCNVSPEAEGGLMEPVPDGLSANGMCVFITSQRESTFHHLILLLQMFLSLLLFSEWCMLSSRWRCLRWISCCRSWRSWVAPAATRRRTPRLQSALPAWLIRGHRVSLSVHSPPPCFCPTWEPNCVA